LIKTKIQSVPSALLRVFEKHSKKSLRVNIYYPLKLAKANLNPKSQAPNPKDKEAEKSSCARIGSSANQSLHF